MPRTKDEARGRNGPPMRKLATKAARKTARPPEPENVSVASTSSSSSDEEERCKKDMAFDLLNSDMCEMMGTFERLSKTAKLDLDHNTISKQVSSIMEALQEVQEEADKKDDIKRRRLGLPRTKEEVRRRR